MKIKRVCATVMVVPVLLTGCIKKERTDGLYSYSKEELIYMYQQAEAAKTSFMSELAEAQSTIEKLSGNSDDSSLISRVSNGSSVMSFNSFDAEIIFPEEFKYPGSTVKVSNPSVYLTESVSVAPNKNWTFKLDGSQMNMEHITNISGKIQVCTSESNKNVNELLDGTLKPWFEANGYSEVNFSNIYVSSIACGVQGKCAIYIDGDKAMLRVGMMAYGNIVLNYIFVYRGEESITKEENIVSLISAITLANQKITVE